MLKFKEKQGNLGAYLAGLIEGDGTIYVPESFRNKKNKINYPYIKICFNIKDKPLALKLYSIFNGNIQVNKLNTFVIWIVYKIDILIEIIKLIGSYFRTSKINKLNNLIKYLNNNFKHFLKKYTLDFYKIDESPIFENAWLSGFADADGSFNITISNRKNSIKKRVMISFKLELKKDESYFFICTTIAEYLGVSLYVRKRRKNEKVFFSYLLIAHSRKSHELICRYFDQYPLFSSKFLNYIDWKQIYLLQKEKKHLSPEGLNLCIKIKNKFNNKRLFFNWKHLSNFYI